MKFDEMTREDLIQKIKELTMKLENSTKVVEFNLVDETTNLLNKRALHHALEIEVKRTVRISSYLNLSLIRINDLDKIAKEHGEKIKQILLSQISSIIERHIRCTDIVGRYDDDVFMIISPDINPFKGIVIAERIQKYISKGNYPLDIEVTTSAGVKHYEGETVDELIDITEEFLSSSCRDGQNEIVTSFKG